MDWENQRAVSELVANILSFVPGIFERTMLTSGDAVPLPQAAAASNLETFNPQMLQRR